ncbi:M23 family metallopeptidase [Candidatus Uhrbacteria bacterium]|nr:M23 family metallopeptidase [Candidatus Uhrbacteria bacterium]
MNLTFKQFIVRSLLGFLRGLIFIKRHSGPLLKKLATPIKKTGLFFARWVGIPSYRLLFFVRRYINKVLLPAKHRIVFVISNRYTVHVMMSFIVLGVAWVNLSARDVRAETFGQQSLLYHLVVQDDSAVLEVVEAGTVTVNTSSTSSYLADAVLDAQRQVDLDYLEETFTSLTGEEAPASEPLVSTRTQVETYTVADGDTLGKIAQSYGLSLSTLLWSNGLTYASTIRPGQELKILPVDGLLYSVKSGDTLSRIAKNYSVDVETILKQNGLTSANTLSIGDELLLPGGEPPAPVTTARASASITNLFVAPQVSAPSEVVGGWVWPTDWHSITQYYGWRHTGIDVDGDYSTYSYAARDGAVIYSGWRNGYGFTVEVDHGDGYVTRYAHHSKLFVSVGDVVTAGQALAQTGSTGRSTGTHLHFEVIRNGKFQNPLDYIR